MFSFSSVGESGASSSSSSSHSSFSSSASFAPAESDVLLGEAKEERNNRTSCYVRFKSSSQNFSFTPKGFVTDRFIHLWRIQTYFLRRVILPLSLLLCLCHFLSFSWSNLQLLPFFSAVSLSFPTSVFSLQALWLRHSRMFLLPDWFKCICWTVQNFCSILVAMKPVWKQRSSGLQLPVLRIAEWTTPSHTVKAVRLRKKLKAEKPVDDTVDKWTLKGKSAFPRACGPTFDQHKHL